MSSKARPTSMLPFTVIWIGQFVSFLGSAMSWFAFTIWAWQTTGEATSLALVEFFAFGPILLLSPVAGALVDRWNRKLTMILGDLATGLGTVVILVLHLTGSLRIWQIYIIAVLAGAFQAFQLPAYSASVTMMVPKKHYARAEGMMELAWAASSIFAPALAAILLPKIGFANIMLIDMLTLALAIGALLFVHIPQPPTTEAGRGGQGNLWKESIYGLRYILERPSLLALESIFAGVNFLDSLAFAVLAPMILSRTGGNEIALGSIQSVGAIGAALGAALLIAWGGPRRRIYGVLIGCMFSSLLGTSLMGLGRILIVWTLASFFSDFTTPIINGSDESIWRAKVAPDVQGRVSGTRTFTSQITMPIGMLLSGPLADHVFEPAMMPDGQLASTFGWLVGTGPGAGMALMFSLAGLLGMLVSAGGFALPAVRNVEDILPDNEVTALAEGSTSANES